MLSLPMAMRVLTPDDILVVSVAVAFDSDATASEEETDLTTSVAVLQPEVEEMFVAFLDVWQADIRRRAKRSMPTSLMILFILK